MSEFSQGMEVEKEHKLIRNNPKERAKFVKEHLKENPKYYTLLAKLEERKVK